MYAPAAPSPNPTGSRRRSLPRGARARAVARCASLRPRRPVQEQDDDDHGGDAGGQRRDRCEQADRHASGRPPPRTSRPASARNSASAPRATATIASVEVPPPPASEETALMVGAGVSDDSGPDQSTTWPSE